MIRKINFTGRKKIRRTSVRVDILRDAEGRRFFNLQADLSDLRLPANARIYAEAYHRTAYQRFDFGSISNRKSPADRRLSRFSAATTPLFRVKVVDRSSAHGRILAALDKIRPETVEREPAGSHALLFVEYDDLGHAIWQLDLDGDWPVLKLNQHVDEIGLVAGSDHRFFALVYPEVFRQVLTRVVVAEDHTDPDCDDDWPSLWLRLARQLPGMSDPPAFKEGRQEWIDQAVEAFSAKFEVLAKFNRAFEELR
ncbi:MAG: hypothetical protein MUD16_10310 [Desulfobacterales bacterium]|jgi:hypothetical protein|nr:hypothetical protein [Desulfobacterales bacterium]